MTGTLFAALAPSFALIAYFGWKLLKDAPKTRKTRGPDFVTHEELEEALKRHRDELEWEWTEMYDKFNKLHLRLTKRDQRKAKTETDVEQEQLEMSDPRSGYRSVLPFRRMGSP